MKKVVAIFSVLLCVLIGTTVTYASAGQNTTNGEVLQSETTGQLIEIKEKELNTLEEYKKSYGSDAYGLTAYLLNKVRLYSIPFGFVAIVISAIYQYVIGIRKLDVRDKGFGVMIASITILVICQVLPLVFAIVVKGWRG